MPRSHHVGWKVVMGKIPMFTNYKYTVYDCIYTHTHTHRLMPRHPQIFATPHHPALCNVQMSRQRPAKVLRWIRDDLDNFRDKML